MVAGYDLYIRYINCGEQNIFCKINIYESSHEQLDQKLKPSKTDEKFANIPLDSCSFSWFQAKRDIFLFRVESQGAEFCTRM